MPLLRINATSQGLVLHETAQKLRPSDLACDNQRGPVIVMLHGYKYAPGLPNHCPHEKIFGNTETGWPLALGFGQKRSAEGLAIAFGWHARGSLIQAHARASALGEALAAALRMLRSRNASRAVHVIAHSLGSEIALSALQYLPADSVNRIVLLTGASYTSHAEAMMDTPAGRTAEVFNITSRENDLFDMAFERLIRATSPADAAIGQGLSSPNAMNLQLDCPETLAVLSRLGLPVAGPRRRVCHWSSYTRPGVMALYARLLRAPASLPLSRFEALLPASQAPRWSRLWGNLMPARISLPVPKGLSAGAATQLIKSGLLPSRSPGQSKSSEHAF
jgi:pimeloyl-ACP methyl ester carboxylesterase